MVRFQRPVMPRPLIALVILLGLSATVAWASPTAVQARYTISVPAGLGSLHVEACFEAGGILDLQSRSPQAGGLLDGLEGARDTQVVWHDDRIQVRLPGRDGCLSYRVGLDAASQHGHWRRELVVATDAILLDPDLFLWLPEGTSDVSVEFRLPPGLSVSAPWKMLASTEQGPVFRTGARAALGDGKVAIGRFETYRLEVAGATIAVALLNGVPAVDRPMVRRWLRANIDAVTAVTGRFPVSRLQLLVVPIGSGDEPVPWGQVSRSGGDAVHLYIDQRMPDQTFMKDWVLSHELSHLFHPYLSDGARWVYEGLASYYQNVSRARAGMMSQGEAWEELHAGFERGRQGTRPGRSLADATENMRAERAYMQVYWSGAAIFLIADLELRQATAQRLSLDRVLEAFADCCLPVGSDWTGPAFLRQLDRLSGSDVFTRLAARHRLSDRFPDMTAAYAQLGLRRLSGGGLAFDDHPGQVAMRASIMGEP